MQALIYSYRALNAEAIKQRPWLIISAMAASLLPVVLFFFAFQFEGTAIMERPGMPDPWSRFALRIVNTYGFTLFPLAVAFWAASLTGMEHQTHGWRNLFSTPLPRWAIFGSKFVYLLGYVLLSFAALDAFMLLGGLILSVTRPDLGFEDFTLTQAMLTFPLVYGVAMLGMTSVVFWLSLRIKNLTLLLGVSMAMVITMGVVAQSEYTLWHPWLYGTLTNKAYFFGFPDEEGTGNWALSNSLCILLVVIPLAYWDTRRRQTL